MDSLSSVQQKVMNELSQLRNQSVLLGDLFQALIASDTENASANAHVSGTPVNAVEAKMNLALTGVVKHGETVTINNPAVEGSDVYEFLATDSLTPSSPSNKIVNIIDNTTKSTVTLTIANKPTSGDTMTIGDKVYTFVPVGTDTADGEVSIGADVAEARLNIVAAINGLDEFNVAHPLVEAGSFVGTDCLITALVGGVAGDAIASTETFTAVGNIFTGATFGSGADCSATNAVTALVAAITAYDTQGVGAADGTGDSVDLTADSAGVAGNAIAVAETLPNGSFTEDATHLAGGVDGTEAPAGKIMFDSTNLYFCLADNTKAGKNWKKIAFSSL